MTLTKFLPTTEKTIDTETNSNLPVVKSAISNKSALGGNAIQHSISPTAGGTVTASSHSGHNSSATYFTDDDVFNRMVLVFNAHNGRVTPDFSQAIADINQPFNFAGIALSDATTPSPTWTSLITKTLPTARSRFDMVYYAAGRYIVLFGGQDASTPRPDTWKWNGIQWLKIVTPHSPGHLVDFAMAYNSNDGRVYLFGGYDVKTQTLSSSTFVFNGTDWTLLSPVTSPTARRNHSLAYDSLRNRLVLFGGTDISGTTFLNDTWEWNGSNWAEVFPSSPPTGRYGHAATFDSSRNKTIVFGGLRRAFSITLNGAIDSVMTTITVDSTAGLEETGTLAIGTELIFYGGIVGSTLVNCVRGINGSTAASHADSSTVYILVAAAGLYEYDGSAYNVISLSGSVPLNRFLHKLTFDSIRNVVLLTGGVSDPAQRTGDYEDTWEYNGSTWTQLQTVGSLQREAFGLAFDPERQQTILFGGQHTGIPNSYNDTWQLKVPDKLRPVSVQTGGDGFVYWDATKPLPLSGDFLGPSNVAGTVTPIADGYSPVFGIAVDGYLLDADGINPLLLQVNNSSVGVIKTQIRPFYGFIPPQAPTISGFTPTAAEVDAVVTVFGTAFVGTTSVKVGSISASFTVISNHQLTFTVPAGAQKDPIEITNSQGIITSTDDFTTLPRIDNATPTGLPAEGATITLTGHTFTNTVSVSFNGIVVLAGSFISLTDDTLVANLPVGATTGPIVLTITYTGPVSYEATFPNFGVILPPTITNLIPLSGPTGTIAYTTLTSTINSSIATIPVLFTTGFPSSGKLIIEDEHISYTAKTSTSFTGCVRGVDSTTNTSHNDGYVVSSTSLNLDGYMQLAGTNFNVDCGACGETDGLGTVEFVSGLQVLKAERTIFSPGIMSVIVPTPTALQPSTLYNVRLTTDGGTVTSSQQFNMVPIPKFLSAASTTLAGGDLSNSATIIQVADTSEFPSAGNFFIDLEQISYTSTDGYHFFGCVRGLNGTHAVSHSNGSTVVVRTFASQASSSADLGKGTAGQIVRIFGDYGFTGTTQVIFHDAYGLADYLSPSVEIINDGYITAIVPTVVSSSDIIGPIIVKSTGGTKSTEDAPTTNPTDFTIVEAPSITSITPTSGKKDDVVVITGANLLSIASVDFLGDGYTVINMGGGLSSVAMSITVTDTSSFPSSGILVIDDELISYTVSDGYTFTVVERGHNGTSAADHDDGTTVTPVVQATVISVTNTQIAAIVPDASTGILENPSSAPIMVTKGGFMARSPQSFLFYPAPSITSISPAADANDNNGGYGFLPTFAVLTGTKLNQGTVSVSFGLVPASITAASDTSITAIVPFNAGGGVRIITSGGQSDHAFAVLRAVSISSFNVRTINGHTTSPNFYNVVDVFGVNFTIVGMTVTIVSPTHGSLPVTPTFFDNTHFSFSSSGLGSFNNDTCTIRVNTTYPGGSYTTSVGGLLVQFFVS